MDSRYKNLLKLLAESEAFDAMKELTREMIWNWTEQRPAGRTEFEYLQNSFARDGKIDGVSAFIREIESYLGR
jgi:hypothetical protein